MKYRNIRALCISIFVLAQGLPVLSAAAANRYAIFLADEPVAKHAASRTEMQGTIGAAWRARIQTSQNAVRAELKTRGFPVTGSADTLLNAIFVVAPPERVAELKAIPGVVDVVKLGKSKMLLTRATQILNGPQAWNLMGGQGNAGAGIKIGILDTGIDQTHPSLQDSSLQTPAGFPKCDVPANCSNFTSNKVIVARSYIAQMAAGSSGNPAADSTPDDYSARDRVGHGTAVATAAAGNLASLAAQINGMAPKAWVGNYKISGSPGVNDYAGNDTFIQALEDAVNDGMDVVTTSFGGTAFTGPLDTGAVCGNAPGVPCDPLAYAFEQAAASGVIVLAAAGNEGEGGPYGTGAYPMFNTISSPANAPSVIAVGATSNTHGFAPAIEIRGSGVPPSLNSVTASFTDAGSPYGAYTAPLVDLTQIGDSTGLGCNPLPQFSLQGDFALIARGTCTFAVKMQNVTDAGAIGAVFYDNLAEALFSPSGLTSFAEPALLTGMNDGQNIKNFIASHPGYPITINPAAVEIPIGGSPVMAGYSSMGPGLGTSGIKPDVLAVGGGSNNGDLIYLGTQNYDPLGEMFSSDRFIAAAGTSFATPLAAGAAALVKQQHPGYTGQQVKSAILNSAAQTVTTDDGGFGQTLSSLNVLQTGAGLVAADAAVQSNVTFVPATVSFGSFAAGGSVSQNQQLVVTNAGSSAVTLGFAVTATTSAAGVNVSISPTSMTLSPGQTGTLTASISGKVGAAGLYYGSITVSGAAVPLHVPYMFLSPFGLTSTVNMDPVAGDQNQAIAGQIIPDGEVAFQLIDGNGAPVVGAPVSFSTGRGSVPLTLSNASRTTDNYGYAYATVTFGPATGIYIVNGTGGGVTYQFTGSVSPAPAVAAGGVVNAASFTSTVAPGSYASIFGTNLSYTIDENSNPLHLPLAMDQVTVSFDAAATGSLPAVSVPGHITYVSPGQVNIQVPWELQGYSSAQMKVTMFGTGFGNVVTVPLATYTPSIFGGGSAAAEDLNGGIISAANPAVRGNYISLFCNGLGPVTNQPGSGEPARGSPLSQTTTQATVTIGGVPATVAFSGLTPTLSGLYQINVQVPSGIAAGNQPVVVSIGGVSSPAATLAVK